MFAPGRFQTRYAKLVAAFVGSAVALLVVLAARDTSMEAQVLSLREDTVKEQLNPVALRRCAERYGNRTRNGGRDTDSKLRLAAKVCSRLHKAGR